jgi:hypothetical protein
MALKTRFMTWSFRCADLHEEKLLQVKNNLFSDIIFFLKDNAQSWDFYSLEFSNGIHNLARFSVNSPTCCSNPKDIVLNIIKNMLSNHDRVEYPLQLTHPVFVIDVEK